MFGNSTLRDIHLGGEKEEVILEGSKISLATVHVNRGKSREPKRLVDGQRKVTGRGHELWRTQRAAFLPLPKVLAPEYMKIKTTITRKSSGVITSRGGSVRLY